MFIKQILNSYEFLTETGSIPTVTNYSPKILQKFDEILSGDISQCLSKMIALNHDPVVFDRKQKLYK